jgi:hypothetical protein
LQEAEKKTNKNSVKLLDSTYIALKDEQHARFKRDYQEPTYGELLAEAWEFYYPFRSLTPTERKALAKLAQSPTALQSILRELADDLTDLRRSPNLNKKTNTS